MNVIVQLECELAFYDSAVHRFNHYTTGTPLFTNWIYLDESKFVQYSSYMRYNSASPDAFAEIMKVMNYSGQWEFDLAWYPPYATHQIYLSGLKHGIGIYGFRPTWQCLIVDIITNLAKFLDLFTYSTVINCTFPFSQKKRLLVASMAWWPDSNS